MIVVMTGLLLDLDGVFYIGDEAVAGAAATARWLRAESVPHLFLTNTTSRPRMSIVQRLRRLGIEVDAADVLTPCVAAVTWLAERGLGHPALFVPDDTAADFAALDPAPIDRPGPVDAVVVGDLGERWDFATLNRAFRLLMTPQRPPLVALGMTRYWRAPDGLRLDTGAFVAALGAASGSDPVVLGKPSTAFYAGAVQALECAPQDVVMVGDDIRTDVAGAQSAGLRGVLVRTGKFAPTDLHAGVVPDAVLDSIAALPAWWADHRP